MRVLLIAGGWSSERDVSLHGAQGIGKALHELGHEVTLFDPQYSLDGLLEAAAVHDFAFLNLHGSPGEDGLVQALLDSVGCPYQGTGPAGSFLALNKAAAKAVFRRHAIPTPDWVFVPARPAQGWTPGLAYPLFVKSNTGGSSLCLSRVANETELHAALEAIFTHGDEAIIEPAIPGVEVTCGILGDAAMPPILIKPAQGVFFDYHAKYTPGAATELCPAPLPPEVTARVQELTLRAHHALGLSGYSRGDFILRENGDLQLLEMNTLPGMTPTSLVPQEAKAIGLDFAALIARLMELGLQQRGPAHANTQATPHNGPKG